ncbi:hypothetical protein J7F03_10100 [Streptomyces sp. ISL-43]|uniref:hypothetical protein n=1 Tax=Streptomyces sp. ISL-43 TaxID=2819183 RepID=UPI001BE958C1|nr:hypothetical protein [Streptomyces sp. ISL-43]MBT2447421.1 hypothetical protein [Streptomyces sp. ISL-43]
MSGIDPKDLDEAIARSFKRLQTAVATHSEQSIHMYRQALLALVQLRAQVATK